VSKKWKKFDTNFELLLEMTWEETLYLENIWRMNRYAKYFMSKNKDYLLGKLVDYDQDSIKFGR